MIILAEPSSGHGWLPGRLHEQTMAWHKACSRSEKLWHQSGGDWRIGHARKDEEAQEMGQSASFILATSLWALCGGESSIIQ